MTHFLIVHGAYGSPEENWFPWLKRQLAPAQVTAPQFPTPEGRDLEKWLKTAYAALHNCQPEDTVMIGHSTGALLVLRLAEQAGRPYKAVIAACPFFDELGIPKFDALNRSFIHPEPDWNAIKRGAQTIRLFAGENDPYVPLKLSQSVAQHLDCNLTVIANGGHLNAEAGMTAFPKLLETLHAIG